MKSLQHNRAAILLLPFIIGVLITLTLLTGCGISNITPTINEATPFPSITAISTIFEGTPSVYPSNTATTIHPTQTNTEPTTSPTSFVLEPTPTFYPVLTPVPGINGDCAVGGPKRINVENCYTDILDDGYIFVRGYTVDENPQQGILLVYTKTLDLLSFGIGHDYNYPTASGPIRIITANLQGLTLQAEDGSQMYFDLLTRNWASPGTPGPTVVPTP